MRHYVSIFLYLVSILNLASCANKSETGTLFIKSPSPGTFELYKIASEEPLQLISESRGSYNRHEKLEAGQYLIMADCSYKTVIINPSKEVTLVSHDIEFLKPTDIDATDNLTVQCHRFTKNHTTQKIKGRFKLKVLHGSHEVLVAMKPLQFDFDKLAPDREPTIVKQQLSAVRVEAPINFHWKKIDTTKKKRSSGRFETLEGYEETSKYFISPTSELLSITSFQKVGEWFLLLAGEYKVELNGTKEAIKLGIGESLSLGTSVISITTSKAIPLDLSKKVLGKPQYVELNSNHWLNLNQKYMVLPGDLKLKLNGSLKPTIFNLEENSNHEIKVSSVTVSFKCKPWDYQCLARKKIYLYKKDSTFPFATGHSDIALLYFKKDAYVSLQGSQKVKYHLSTKKRDHSLNAGYITFVPNYRTRSQYFTDLTRIETISKNFIGDSIDFPIRNENKIPLITGVYSLAQYNSTVRGEFDRQKKQFKFYVSKEKERTINYKVNLSERKYKYYTKNQKKSSTLSRSISRKNIERLSPSIKFQ